MNTNSNTDPLSLDFICKLIPFGFSGDRNELGQFLANCNSANELASQNQKLPLLYFILSRISGTAKEQLTTQSFESWEILRQKLKDLYKERKHYVQLIEELNNCRQNSNESVDDFFQRLEVLYHRTISSAQQSYRNDAELPGKTQTIRELTLNRFIYHSKPEISQMLRYKGFNCIKEAHNAALCEERILNMLKTNKSNQYCKICRNNSHSTNNCCKNYPQSNGNYRVHVNNSNKSNNHNFNHTFNQPSSNSQHNNIKQCKYCKKYGHTIDECRKLQYKNSYNVFNKNKNPNDIQNKNFNRVSNQNQIPNEVSNIRSVTNNQLSLNSHAPLAEKTPLEESIKMLQVFEN
ncbi:putative uncharacterized protein DDB_G0272516 [Sitophilus oryzae]|uniref:Retrotransposon gag domain-containing protein n=1 Tax=Sitophilus oryzae TaxID=7048 RepID=A0A6J2YU81_SITOR|nr:putative uncharacterized protein DDB_G0272516 [Sitophilus oryzae]